MIPSFGKLGKCLTGIGLTVDMVGAPADFRISQSCDTIRTAGRCLEQWMGWEYVYPHS